MSQRAILWGVLRYEFKMQVRRRSLWIVFAGIVLILLNTLRGSLNNSEQYFSGMTMLQQVATVTVDINWLPMIGIGIFLADRFPRDRSNRVDELLETTVGTLKTRLIGKYLGCLLATLLPAFLVYTLIIGILAVYMHTLLVFPLSLVTYAAIVLPGVCFIAAFTLACTSLMWVPLYQLLFVGYWFWGNMFGPQSGLPSLSTTILTPVGSFIGAGFFGVSPMKWTAGTTPLLGLTSMVLLLLIPFVVMLVFYRYLKWEQFRK